MRKLILAIGLMILGVMAQKSLQPMSALAQAPAKTPAPVATSQHSPVADADAKVIAPLLEKATDIQKQMQQIVAEANAKLAPLRTQLNGPDGKSGIEHDLSIAETDAYSHAKVDSRFTQIMKDASGILMFAPRQQGIPQPQH